jgi:LysR family transcriptional regulator for metE and metH
MDVDIRDLELLEALGEHATLTAAARHLYVSQPALSQRLLRLEERLATPLFERRGRQLVANAAGRRMLQAAQTTLRELRAARLDLHELADGRRRPLRLASQCSTNYEWITDVVRPLHQRLPRTELRIEPLPDDDPIAALFDDELRAVVSSSHPWASRASVAAADFGEVHLVLCDGYDQARTPAMPLPIPPGARPARLTTAPIGVDMLIELVATGDAVTVLPSWVIAPYLATHDVASVAVGDPPRRRTWYCATRPERSDVIDAVVAILHAHLAGEAPRARTSPAA